MRVSFAVVALWIGHNISSAVEYAASVVRAAPEALIPLAESHAKHELIFTSIYLITFIVLAWCDIHQKDKP